MKSYQDPDKMNLNGYDLLLLKALNESNSLNVNDFYNKRPFLGNRTPGKVIRYLFLITKKLSLSEKHSDLNREKIFTNIMRLLAQNNIEDFEAGDCSMALFNMAYILTITTSLKDAALPPSYIKLITTFYNKLNDASEQGMDNVFWAIAKLILIDQILDVDSEQVKGILAKCYNEKMHDNFPRILHALSIMSTKNKKIRDIPFLDEFIRTIFEHIVEYNDSEKSMILQGLGVLMLDKRYENDLKPLIDLRRPTSNITDLDIAHYIKNIENYKIEREAYVHGFFVDLLLTDPNGKKIIIEFDGMNFHGRVKRQIFDQFRDKLLFEFVGCPIYRIVWNGPPIYIQKVLEVKETPTSSPALSIKVPPSCVMVSKDANQNSSESKKFDNDATQSAFSPTLFVPPPKKAPILQLQRKPKADQPQPPTMQRK